MDSATVHYCECGHYFTDSTAKTTTTLHLYDPSKYHINRQCPACGLLWDSVERDVEEVPHQ